MRSLGRGEVACGRTRVRRAAAAPPSVPGTSAVRALVHKLPRWLPAVVGILWLAATAGAWAADTSNVLVVEDDGRILSPAEPLPLSGRRLSFTPTDGAGYATQLGPSRGLLRRGTHIDFQGSPDGVVRIALKTPFSYFGTQYGEVYVHAQGALSFGEPIQGGPRADKSGALLSGILGGPPAVAALWNELQVPVGDPARGVFVDQTDAALVVTWYQVPSVRPAGELNTFRLTLSASGAIDLDYGAMGTRWGIVGLSPGQGRDGVRLVDFASAPAVAPRTATLAWYRDLPVLNEIALARKVYERLPDRFQFLTVFTTQPVDGPSPVWSTTVQNADRGIGMPIFDHSALFGGRTLEHIVVMNDVGFYADDPQQSPLVSTYAYAPSTLAVLAHEIGHRWLAYAGGIDQGLAGADGHWSYGLDSGASFLGGNALKANGDGSFTSLAAMTSYGPLDRYLMGFSAPGEVAPFFVVDDAHDFLPPRTRGGELLGPDSHPEAGVTFHGTRRDVTIDDVIEHTGTREPDASKARTTFRMATVLVVPAGEQADDAQLAKVERIRRAFGPFFRMATGNRGHMRTWLPASEAERTVPPDPVLLSGRPRLLDGTVRRDQSGRATVALDYADFDGDLTALEVSADGGSAPPATVDVALGTLGNRRGSVAFALRDLPPGATTLRLALIDNRGLTSHAALRVQPEPAAAVASR